MSPDTIVLIAAISLFILGYIYLLLKVTQLEFVGGLVGKQKIRVFGFLFGSLVITYLFYKLSEIQPNEWVEISLLAGLVGATSALAMYAAGQAYTSVKMAKLMTKPRLIPDIHLASSFDKDRNVYFEASVHNDGSGPAYDLELWIEDDSTPPSRLISHAHKISILRREDYVTWRDPPLRLHFPHSDKVQRRFFVIEYRDVDGEYEIRQPFILTTKNNNRPYATRESVSKRMIRKINLEEELP